MEWERERLRQINALIDTFLSLILVVVPGGEKH